MEFGTHKYAKLVMKSSKRHMIEPIELPNKEKLRTFGEKESNTWGYLKLTPSNKWRRKKKLRKSISGEPESYERQNYIAGTL